MGNLYEPEIADKLERLREIARAKSAAPIVYDCRNAIAAPYYERVECDFHLLASERVNHFYTLTMLEVYRGCRASVCRGCVDYAGTRGERDE